MSACAFCLWLAPRLIRRCVFFTAVFDKAFWLVFPNWPFVCFIAFNDGIPVIFRAEQQDMPGFQPEIKQNCS